MTLTRRERTKARNRRYVVEKLRAEGRLREATSRCGPWEILPNGGERCLKCNAVDYPYTENADFGI